MSATLERRLEKVSVNYTDKLGDVLPALKDVDVLYIKQSAHMIRKCARRSLNLPTPVTACCWCIRPFGITGPIGRNTIACSSAAARTAMTNMANLKWSVKEPKHPVMAGVPATFKITDELYHFEIDPQGTPIEVLAEGEKLRPAKRIRSSGS